MDALVEQIMKQAMEQLFEDESLTADLMDDEAAALLKWAEGEIRRLAEQAIQGVDAATASETVTTQLHTLRQQLRQVARQSAKAADPMAELQTLLAALPQSEAPAMAATKTEETTDAPQPVATEATETPADIETPWVEGEASAVAQEPAVFPDAPYAEDELYAVF